MVMRENGIAMNKKTYGQTQRDVRTDSKMYINDLEYGWANKSYFR